MRGITAVVVAVLFWCGTIANTDISYAQSSYTRVDQLKAAFLSHFAHFIQWPNESALTQFNLCVWGEAPLQTVLMQLLIDKSVRNHALRLRSVENLEQVLDCQLVFISAARQAQLTTEFEQLNEHAVLSVADAVGFAKIGGIIEFYIENNKLRFIINLANARQAGLKISPELLDMAIVTGQ